MKKILITGCARSGTTLLLFLMKYLKNSQVFLDKEYMPTKIFDKKSFYFIGDVDESKILVIKRPVYPKSHKNHIDFKDILSCDFRCIFIIRDVRDILCSKHPPNKINYYVDTDRCCFTYDEIGKYKKNNDFLFIKYEDLVTKTDDILNEIGDFIGSSFVPEYKNFYNYVIDDSSIKHGKQIYGFGVKGSRPIDSDSVCNWKLEEHRERMKNIVGGTDINRICKILIEYGYEKDNIWINNFY